MSQVRGGDACTEGGGAKRRSEEESCKGLARNLKPLDLIIIEGEDWV